MKPSSQLIAIQVRGLGEVEVGAVGQVGEDEFVGEVEVGDRWWEAFAGRGECRYRSCRSGRSGCWLWVDEKVKSSRRRGVETVERVLTLGGGEQRGDEGGLPRRYRWSG